MGMLQDIDTRMAIVTARGPRVRGYKSSVDEQLRVVALRAARVQFATAEPGDLIKVADQLFDWLKHGPRVSEEEIFDRVDALCKQGTHVLTACESVGVEPLVYFDISKKILASRNANT